MPLHKSCPCPAGQSGSGQLLAVKITIWTLQILPFVLIDLYQLLAQACLLILQDTVYRGAAKLNVLAKPYAHLFFVFYLFSLSRACVDKCCGNEETWLNYNHDTVEMTQSFSSLNGSLALWLIVFPYAFRKRNNGSVLEPRGMVNVGRWLGLWSLHEYCPKYSSFLPSVSPEEHPSHSWMGHVSTKGVYLSPAADLKPVSLASISQRDSLLWNLLSSLLALLTQS